MSAWECKSFFVSMVQMGQMTVAVAFMLWYDPALFLMVLGLAPVLWAINNYFVGEIERGCAASRFVQPRDGDIGRKRERHRVTQGFVRQDVNAQLFGDLVRDHAEYNSVVNRTQGLFLPLLDLNSQLFVAWLLLSGRLSSVASRRNSARWRLGRLLSDGKSVFLAHYGAGESIQHRR